MKVRPFVFALLATVLVSSTAAGKLNVVTTIQTLRSLAEEVGGDHITTTALVSESVDPHFVDPRPSYAVVLNRADLLIYVGLDLEKGWLPPLIGQSRNPRIQAGLPGNLDASTSGIFLLDLASNVSRAQGDIHPAGNPHYWLPPANAAKIARAIAARLGALDPKNAVYYQTRVAAFETKLKTQQAAWDKAAQKLRGVKVITYHNSWHYLTSWLKITEIGHIEPKPGVPPSAANLASLVQQARAQEGRLVLVESYYSRNTAQRVADVAGMKLLVLPSDTAPGQTYFQLVDSLLAQLGGAI